MSVSDVRALLLATVLALSGPAGMIDATPASAAAGDGPGDFDFYILALSIAPSFCDLTGYRKHKAQCEHPSDADYRATPLTVHGLWPNRRNTSASNQPHACSTEKLPSFADDLAENLRRYMPGVADGLPQYEWSKHGVCSGLTPDAYFREIVALAKAANDTIGAAMKDKDLIGKPMPVSALLDAVAAKNPALADAIVVDCQFSRKGRGDGPRAYVSEIRVLIAKDAPATPGADGWPASFVPRTSVGYGANSGCPKGVGYLPGGFDQ
jgi:ribonuclease T2